MSDKKKSVVIIGAGNIGGPAIDLVARTPQVGALTLVDKDVYTRSNLVSQPICLEDVGLPKAVAQARHVRQINQALPVRAFHADLADLPLGLLRADLWLTCVDSNRTRQLAGEAAWRLDIPLVDAGVTAAGLLARVSVFVPGRSAPCLECAWDDRHYAALDQRWPCRAGQAEVPSTGAPAALGSLAASLQVLQARLLLAGDHSAVAAGRQIVLDAISRRLYDSALRKRRDCRFDHASWNVRLLRQGPQSLLLGQALALGSPGRKPPAHAALGVEGKVFVRKLACPQGHTRALLRLSGRLQPQSPLCRQCGQAMFPLGFESETRLSADRLRGPELGLSLRQVGFLPGDIFSLSTRGAAAHYQLAGDLPGRARRPQPNP